MKPAVGTLLIVAAIAAFAWGITHGGMHFSRQDSVVQSGAAEGAIIKTNSLPLAPIAGAVLLVAGVIVLVSSRGTSGPSTNAGGPTAGSRE